MYNPIRKTVLSIILGLAVVSTAPALIINFDYSYDSSGFYTTDAKTTMAAVGDLYGGLITSSLDAITPGGGNTWSQDFYDPATGNIVNVSNPNVGADSITIYLGSRTLAGSTLGIGGPGGYSSSGSFAWNQAVANRGSAAAAAGEAVSVWGGSISFSDSRTWNFDLGAPTALEYDFYSVALHEVGHVLGIGTSTVWSNQVSGGFFTGTFATEANGGVSPGVDGGGGHWVGGLNSPNFFTDDVQGALYGPSIAAGTRRGLSDLDVAGLKDLGWEVVPEPTTAILVGFGALMFVFRRQRA